MSIQINIGSKSVVTLLVVASFIIGSQVAEAASVTSPKVLCVQKSGVVVSRQTCKSGESTFSVMPGKVTKKAIKKTVIGVQNVAAVSDSSIETQAASSVSSLSLLSASPRIYTSLVEIPAGMPIGTTLEDVGPSCTSDAPLKLVASAQAIPDNSPGSQVVEMTYTQSIGLSSYDSWYVMAVNGNGSDPLKPQFVIQYFTESSSYNSPLPRPIRFYLSVLCAPNVELVPAS